jgi:NitT/TauT family transport system substrate-binding protein
MKSMGRAASLLLSIVVVLAITNVVFASPVSQKLIFALGNPTKLSSDARFREIPTHMGYFGEEGIEVEYIPCSGSLVATQLVIAGKADLGNISPETVIKMRQEGVQLRTIFSGIRDYPWYFAVMKDSKISSYKDLKGRKIGISSLGSAANIFATSLVKEAGLDPDKDVTIIPVGMGAAAANSLKSGQVDALAFWTMAFAAIENAGYKLRYLENPDAFKKIWTQGHVTTEKTYMEKRKLMIGFGRAVAKATLFTLINPKAAVKIWYKVNPELKPIGTDAEIAKKFKDDLHILEVNNVSVRVDNRRVKRWGWVDRIDYEAIQDYFYSVGHLKKKSTAEELDRCYADKEFLEEVNHFNQQNIIEQAKKYKD